MIRCERRVKPGPIRKFDYEAWDDERYDVDCDEEGYYHGQPNRLAFGETEEEARANLKELLEQ